jgi:hypothetical protein
MRLFVLIRRTGKVVEIDVVPSHTILEVKQYIAQKELQSPAVGEPGEHLLADDQELANNDLTLHDYGIGPDAQLELSHYERPARPTVPTPAGIQV